MLLGYSTCIVFSHRRINLVQLCFTVLSLMTTAHKIKDNKLCSAQISSTRLITPTKQTVVDKKNNGCLYINQKQQIVSILSLYIILGKNHRISINSRGGSLSIQSRDSKNVHKSFFFQLP